MFGRSADVIAPAALMVAAAASLAGCGDWRNHVEPGRTTAPIQTLTKGVPNALAFGSVQASLTPRARYRLTAYALITDNTMRDAWSAVSGLDIAFAWGRVAHPAVLRHLVFHLKRRYLSVYFRGSPPVGPKTIMNHLGNHHLVAADEEVAAALARIQPGDLVSLEGDLVDIVVAGQHLKTSLSRTDAGDGACEVLYVERVEIENPTSGRWWPFDNS